MNYPSEAALIISATLFCTNMIGTYSIINGRDPKLNEVRYMVAVLGRISCSGGIIGNKHVITAAHCVKIGKNNKLESIKVIAATNASREYDPKVSIVKYVRRVFLLAAYAKKKPLHDIAVLELSGSIRIDANSEKLQKLDLPTPINLNPSAYSSYENVKFKAAGFGASKYKYVIGKNGKKQISTYASGRLHVANGIVHKNKVCTRVYGGKLENRMCVAIIDDSQNRAMLGLCKGDSGAPIVLNGTIIIGLMAAGNCDKTYTPSVAVRTTGFVPFIENAMNGVVTSDMKIYDAW